MLRNVSQNKTLEFGDSAPQDNSTELLREGTNPDSGHIDTYLDHFILCSRNPTLQTAPTQMGQGCMSKGGIPVQPYYVLGGYGGKKAGEGEGYTSKFIF
jgi:hypothetical protein